jgi:hypothetical protein
MINYIEIGKTNYYDDGKIRESRRSSVIVTDIIPFGKIDKSILNLWSEEVESCGFLYANETDFFISGILDNEKIFFVRTIDGGWFSIGYNGGRLDYDGSLTLKLKK